MRPVIKPGAVVVGLDALGHSETTVAWAAGYARAHQAPLHLLHAAGGLGPAAVPHRAEAAQILRAASRPVLEHARDLVDRFASGLDVTVLAPLEDPEDALVTASESAAMLVVGSRRLRARLTSFTLGSVGLSVAARAHCPVTVVPRPSKHPGARAPVVVGLDVHQWSRAALDVAFGLAATTSRRLVVVYAWPVHGALFDSGGHAHQLGTVERNERLLSGAIAGYGARYPGVVVDTAMPDAGPVDCLVNRSLTASHVVVGTRERHGLAAVLGSVSRGVLEQAHCPVTVARPHRTAAVGDALDRELNRV